MEEGEQLSYFMTQQRYQIEQSFQVMVLIYKVGNTDACVCVPVCVYLMHNILG